jgi:tight adherence protein B
MAGPVSESPWRQARVFCLLAAEMCRRGVDLDAGIGAGLLGDEDGASLPARVRRRGRGRRFGEQLLAECDGLPHGSAAEREVRAAWSRVAAAVLVCEQTGAPLSAGFELAAGWLERRIEEESRRVAAVAGPAATSRLLTLLPLLGLASAAALGADAISVLFGTLLGWGLLVAAAGLTLIGVRWRRAVLRRIRFEPGSNVWLVRAGLGGGASLARVRRAAEAAAARCGLDGGGAGSDRVDRISTATGIPATILIDEELARERAEALERFDRTAARVENAVLVPAVCCHLPAFVLVGVVPMTVSLLSTLRW